MFPGPNRLIEMAYVAREHYVQGVPMVELASKTGMSRFRVARLLAEAREHGVLRIVVDAPQALGADEISEICSHYGLQRFKSSAHTEASSRRGTERDVLAKSLAEYLSASVAAHDVIGVTGGGPLALLSSHLQALPPSDVVQLTGLAGEPDETAGETLRALAQATAGRSYPLHVPLVASDASAADTMRVQPGAALTLAQMERVTKAVIALGSWIPPQSQVAGSLAVEHMQEALVGGVRADMAGSLFDVSGAHVPLLHERLIAVPYETLRAIPEVILVVAGLEHMEALRAALRTGLVTTLIADRGCALALLAESRQTHTSGQSCP